MIDATAHVFFKIVGFVMKVAWLGAFGAMAFTIGRYGLGTLVQLGSLMLGFYTTCLIFVLVVLGAVAWWTGFSIFKFIRYIKEELLIVLGTSSSETVLPRMLAKLENLGCEKSVVGLVIPTGYSFNLDGTCIYLTMAAVFLAQATNTELTLGQELGLIGILLLTSKGAAGVTGSGFIVLAATLSSLGTVPVASIALILGVDRFMSEARALTNLVGNGVATVVVAKWEGALDMERLRRQLDGETDAEADNPEDVLVSGDIAEEAGVAAMPRASPGAVAAPGGIARAGVLFRRPVGGPPDSAAREERRSMVQQTTDEPRSKDEVAAELVTEPTRTLGRADRRADAAAAPDRRRRRRRGGPRTGDQARRHPRPARRGRDHPRRALAQPSVEAAAARGGRRQHGRGRARPRLPGPGALAPLPLPLRRDDRARPRREGGDPRADRRRRGARDHPAAELPLRHAGDRDRQRGERLRHAGREGARHRARPDAGGGALQPAPGQRLHPRPRAGRAGAAGPAATSRSSAPAPPAPNSRPSCTAPPGRWSPTASTGSTRRRTSTSP